MSHASRILFTLEPYTPEVDFTEDQSRINYETYLEFLSRLTDDGASKLNSAIISTARYVIESSNKPNYNYNKDISKMFLNDSISKLDNICPEHKLCLIERISIHNDSCYRPTNCWMICPHLIKAVLIQSFNRYSFDKSDMDKILDYYHLDEYYDKVYCGAINDDDVAKYAMPYNYYLFEFYIRSESPDPYILNSYYDKSKYRSMHNIFNLKNEDIVKTFKYDLTMHCSFEQTEHNIKELSNDMIFYARKEYEINYPTNMFRSRTGKGNSHYSKQFPKWDRYLRTYDLYKKNTDAGKELTPGRIDAISKAIVSDFPRFKESTIRDLRKETVKAYNEAQRLINLSTEGYLL